MRVPMAGWAAVVAVTLAGCATDESYPVSEPTRTPPVLEAPASPSAEELALDAYLEMWAAVVEGSHQGATEHPDLGRYASGQALELTSQMLTGVEATGEPVLSPEVADTDFETSPQSVWIEDCGDDSGWLVTGQDGSVRTESRLIRATVHRVPESGSWKVDELWMGDYGSC